MIILIDIVAPKKILHLSDNFNHLALGLLYVGSALQKAGYKVEIAHVAGEGDDEELKRLVEKKPLFIGFSVLTGYFTEYAINLSQRIKALDPSITIVWGGIHPSMTPKQCMEENCIDVVCIGEGEHTIVDLAQMLEEGKSLRKVRSIAFREEGIPYFTEPRPLIQNLDECDMDLSLVDYSRFITRLDDGQKVYATVTSRGCPFTCSFCYNNMFNRRSWRSHSPDFVVDKVLQIKEKYGITGVIFFDDNFIVNKKRAFTILERLKEAGVICYSFDLRIDSVNEEVARKLHDLEVKALYTGIDSGSPRVIELLTTRKPDIDTKVEKLRILSKYSVRVWASFIIGLPTETWDEIMDTVRLAIRISKVCPRVIFSFYCYVPWPGSELYNLAVKEGFEPPKTVEGWSKLDWDLFKSHWSPKFGPEDLKDLRMIIKYVQNLNNERDEEKGIWPWAKYRVKNFFYNLACYRLSHRKFFLPIDLEIYRFLRRIHVWLEKRG